MTGDVGGIDDNRICTRETTIPETTATNAGG